MDRTDQKFPSVFDPLLCLQIPLSFEPHLDIPDSERIERESGNIYFNKLGI